MRIIRVAAGTNLRQCPMQVYHVRTAGTLVQIIYVLGDDRYIEIPVSYTHLNNNELVAVYGNFVNRALQLTKKYFDSVVPAAGELNDYDRETLKEFANVQAEVENLLDCLLYTSERPAPRGGTTRPDERKITII